MLVLGGDTVAAGVPWRSVGASPGPLTSAVFGPLLGLTGGLTGGCGLELEVAIYQPFLHDRNAIGDAWSVREGTGLRVSDAEWVQGAG